MPEKALRITSEHKHLHSSRNRSSSLLISPLPPPLPLSPFSPPPISPYPSLLATPHYVLLNLSDDLLNRISLSLSRSRSKCFSSLLQSYWSVTGSGKWDLYWWKFRFEEKGEPTRSLLEIKRREEKRREERRNCEIANLER